MPLLLSPVTRARYYSAIATWQYVLAFPLLSVTVDRYRTYNFSNDSFVNEDIRVVSSATWQKRAHTATWQSH